jgi:phage shock protein E
MNFIVTVKELHHKMVDKVPPAIIDVREPETYGRGHLPGAINIPGSKIGSSLNQLPLDRPIITYCNMHLPGSSLSEDVAEELREAGLPARALKGGFPEWEAAGYPIETGEGTALQRRRM